jgi:hypothetical protein
MDEQQNTRLVQQAYERFKTGDLESFLNSLDPLIEWQLPAMENVPFAGTWRGREGVSLDDQRRQGHPLSGVRRHGSGQSRTQPIVVAIETCSGHVLVPCARHAGAVPRRGSTSHLKTFRSGSRSILTTTSLSSHPKPGRTWSARACPPVFCGAGQSSTRSRATERDDGIDA